MFGVVVDEALTLRGVAVFELRRGGGRFGRRGGTSGGRTVSGSCCPVGAVALEGGGLARAKASEVGVDFCARVFGVGSDEEGESGEVGDGKLDGGVKRLVLRFAHLSERNGLLFVGIGR